jgi:predicted small lipoprotein YifL
VSVGASGAKLSAVRRNRPATRRALRACGTVALLVMAVGLADCGKKGPPVAPPGVPNVYPRTYPRE